MGIIEYISIGSIIVSVMAFVINTFCTNKTKKNTVGKFNKIITLISEIIPKAMIYGENNATVGENKKIIALSKILIDCAANGISYEEEANEIDETIEKLIKFSKEVNAVTVKKEV